MRLSKGQAAAIAAEAVRIQADGSYRNLNDQIVWVRDDLARAVAGTIEYPPDAELPVGPVADHETVFEVTPETTLAAAERLVTAGFDTVALNYASAKHAGGGFLSGAIAQEESLCRSSGLFACLKDRNMYRHHARIGGGFYTNYAIYSPRVPVFFLDSGSPLPQPYLCSFITSPAVNAGTYLRDRPTEGVRKLRAEMADRIEKVLDIAAGHGHDAAVLGAWGCGVFRNEPELIAELFHEAFAVRFARTFRRVVFAVYSPHDDSPLRAFETHFGS